MKIEPFCPDDIAPFLTLAAAEGWVAGEWEFELLLSHFSQGCFVARADNGELTGYVTSLKHKWSGWIGNLIVAQSFRGMGIGGSLFRNALEALWQAGAQTVWLTASESGIHLYEKYGFTKIDTISRWSGIGRSINGGDAATKGHAKSSDSTLDLDALAWGDRREALLQVAEHRGTVWQNESGFVVIQPYDDLVQVGPFSVVDSSNAERLFDAAVKTIPCGTKILVDAPISNCSASRLFGCREMAVIGSNALMYAGKKPDYRPELLYGLATMGSCG